MGLFENFGDTLKNIAGPVISAVTGSPFTAALQQGANIASMQSPPKLEGTNMFDYSNPLSGGSSFNQIQPLASQPIAKADTGFFGGLRSFGREATGFIRDIAPALDYFGVGPRGQQTAPQAAQSLIRQAPSETSSSGELLGANLGMAGNVIGAAGRFLRTPSGSAALGFGGGALGLALGGGANGAPRITRRMKSDVRRIYNMSMGNPDITAQILNQMGTYPKINFDAPLVFFILTKRFRNDGPVVTKAAVRKTKTTLRRMKGVVDMYNSVCKPTTRRAPTRRAAPKAVQLIKN